MGSEKRMKDDMGWEAPESPPRCANGCGFFGSPANQNLCSKCYKDFCLKQGQPSFAMDFMKKSEHLTHSPTTSITSTTMQLQQLSIPSSSSRGTFDVNPTVAAATVESSPLVKNRCVSCRKKIGLLGFRCRCGSTFCSEHRYPEMHSCTFDYKSLGKDAIARANPVVKADKIERF